MPLMTPEEYEESLRSLKTEQKMLEFAELLKYTSTEISKGL
jgi:hypothetical protein